MEVSKTKIVPGYTPVVIFCLKYACGSKKCFNHHKKKCQQILLSRFFNNDFSFAMKIEKFFLIDINLYKSFFFLLLFLPASFQENHFIFSKGPKVVSSS